MAIALSSLNVPPPYALKFVGNVTTGLTAGTRNFISSYTCEEDYALCTFRAIADFSAIRYYTTMNRTALNAVTNFTNYTPDVSSNINVSVAQSAHYSDPGDAVVLAGTKRFFDSFVPQVDGHYKFAKGSYIGTFRGEGASSEPDRFRTLVPAYDNLIFMGAYSSVSANTRTDILQKTVRATTPYVNSYYDQSIGYDFSGSGGQADYPAGDGPWLTSYLRYFVTNSSIGFRGIIESNLRVPEAAAMGLMYPSYRATHLRSGVGDNGDVAEDNERDYGVRTNLMQEYQRSLLNDDLGSFWIQRGQVLENFHGTVELFSLG